VRAPTGGEDEPAKGRVSCAGPGEEPLAPPRAGRRGAPGPFEPRQRRRARPGARIDWAALLKRIFLEEPRPSVGKTRLCRLPRPSAPTTGYRSSLCRRVSSLLCARCCSSRRRFSRLVDVTLRASRRAVHARRAGRVSASRAPGSPDRRPEPPRSGAARRGGGTARSGDGAARDSKDMVRGWVGLRGRDRINVDYSIATPE
jgi:hypothetical protein